jgi:ATPase family associated with various cellular activities (AAA)
MSSKMEEFFLHQKELLARLPLMPDESAALDDGDIAFLKQHETNWTTYFSNSQPEWSMALMAAVYSGELPTCPGCNNTRYVPTIQKGAVTGLILRSNEQCQCVPYRFIQNVIDETIPRGYRLVDLWTLQPSRLSQLPLHTQADEIEMLRHHHEDNYLFLGPAGTSKTTFSIALYREAMKRNKLHIMSAGFRGVPPRCRTQFVWRINGEELFTQNQAYKTTMTSEKPAPPPDVTVERIQRAARAGIRPVIILEEIDKTRLTEPRMNLLFALFDAIDGAKGQIVLTTNRDMDRFIAMFTESEIETVRVSAEPFLRRLFKNCNIRNYYETTKEKP